MDVLDNENIATWCIVCKSVHFDGKCEYEGLCGWCKTRPATLHFGDMLSFTHGGGENCCEICATQQQLDHAVERASQIHVLRDKLAALLKVDNGKAVE